MSQVSAQALVDVLNHRPIGTDDEFSIAVTLAVVDAGKSSPFARGPVITLTELFFGGIAAAWHSLPRSSAPADVGGSNSHCGRWEHLDGGGVFSHAPTIGVTTKSQTLADCPGRRIMWPLSPDGAARSERDAD